jgi:uncharacterized protein (TIGR02099 family)
MSNKSKLIAIFLISFLGFSTLFYVFANYLNTKANQAIYKLADKLSAKIGQNVKIGSVATRWRGLSLKIDIKDLVVLDNTTETPLLMVNRIVSTVDALKTLLTFKVKFKHLLLNSPRLAIEWDGINPPRIIGLSTDNLTSKLNISEFLQLLAQQHNITIQQGDFHIQGFNHTDIPLMDVSLEIKEHASLDFLVLLRGSVAAANPPEFNAALHFLGSIADPTKFMLDFEIKTSNLQVDDLLNLIPKYKQNLVRGSFADLDAKGAIQNGTLKFINTEFNIENLRIGSTMGVKGGKGKILFKPGDEKVSFFLQNFIINEISNPLYVVPVQLVSGDVKSVLENDELSISSDNLNIKLSNMDFKSYATAKINADRILECSVDTKINNGILPKVIAILPPRILGDNLTNWLQQSLIAGEVKTINLDLQQQRVLFKTEVNNAELQYSTSWPSIHSINAQIIYDAGKLDILTQQAMVMHANIRDLKTQFLAKNNRENTLVKLSGNVSTTLETGLEYLSLTPLKSKIADKIATFTPRGDFDLALNLAIDLGGSDIDVAVNGSLELQKDSIKLSGIKLPVSDISGRLEFDNNSLSAPKLHLLLANKPATAQIFLDSKKNSVIQIKVASDIDMATVVEMFPDLNMRNIRGTTAFNAQIDIPWQTANADQVFLINSNLEGIQFDFPPPLYKPQQTKMPLQMKCYVKANSDKTLYFKLANLLDANLQIINNKVITGQIAINSVALPVANKNLLISGKIPQLDLDAWKAWQQQYPQQNISRFDFDIFVKELTFHGEKYSDVRAKYDLLSNNYDLETPIIKGVINITKEEDKIAITLDKFDVPPSKAKDNEIVAALRSKNIEKQLPIIQFYCENLRISGQNYRKVSMQLLPRTYGYEIIEFGFSNDNILLQAQGRWQMDNPEFTELSGNAYAKNLGLIVKDLSFGKSIGKGNGELNFSLQWPGDPTQFALAKVEGTSHLELQNGFINGVNPGLGRMIGLLNLESIQRRLKLDFSDLNNKGLAFDTLSSDLDLKNATVSTNKMLINCPSARIELNGKSNLETHELDFNIFVTPKVGVGLPVAAAIAVANPLVGAAVWLVDQASGSKISEITRYKYKVSGTWESPKIEEVTAQHDPKS